MESNILNQNKMNLTRVNFQTLWRYLKYWIPSVSLPYHQNRQQTYTL